MLSCYTYVRRSHPKIVPPTTGGRKRRGISVGQIIYTFLPLTPSFFSKRKEKMSSESSMLAFRKMKEEASFSLLYLVQ
jgi:hypothetical protein